MTRIFFILLIGLVTACATNKPTVEQTSVTQAVLCSEVASADELRETLLTYRYDEGGKWVFRRGSRMWSGPVSLRFKEQVGSLWAYYRGSDENKEWFPEARYPVELHSNKELSFGFSSGIKVNLELQEDCILEGTVRGDWGTSSLSIPPHKKNM